MAVHQVFAEILDDKVLNIMVCNDYETANRLARGTYGNSAFAVECTQYEVFIGCTYKEGRFYGLDGKEVLYIPTEQQQISCLQTENRLLKQETEELTLALADMIGGVSDAE